MALMTLQEVANYLRVTTKTIYRLLDARRIPARKVGRQWRFDKDSIDSWLSQESVQKAAKLNCGTGVSLPRMVEEDRYRRPLSGASESPSMREKHW